MGYMEDASMAISQASNELDAGPCQMLLQQVDTARVCLAQAGEIVATSGASRLAQIQQEIENLQALIMASKDAFQQAASTVLGGGSISGNI